MIKSFLLLFVATLWCFVVTGQVSIPRNYIPPSPDAAALGSFVDASMGSYSGLADINVPLYELKRSGVSVPISLNYYAGGIRQADEAGWVGLNWSLLAGGVIARVKKDRDDFASDGYYRTAPALRFCSDGIDNEPDMFYYNFGGHQGKFMLDYTPSFPGYLIREVIKSNLRIVMNSLGTSWTISTPDGAEYEFQKKEITDEHFFTSDGTNENTTHTSAWYLTRIKTPANDQIDFIYNSISERIYRKRVKFNSRTYLSMNPIIPGATGCSNWNSARGFDYNHSSTSETWTDEVILNRINFSGGYISFSSDNRLDLNTVSNFGKKLSSIKIYQAMAGVYEPITSFNFMYDYYTSGSALPDKISKRLRLLSVQESSFGLTKPAYQFLYYGNTLPDKNIESSLNLGYVGNSKSQMLQRIVFPTGGNTTYEYENHSATDVESLAVTDGGARIKKISQTDGVTAEINIRKFQYTGGKLMGRLTTNRTVDISQPVILQCPQWAPQTEQHTSLTHRYTFSFECGALGELSNNHVIGYDQVTMLNGENGENGKIVYDFENASPTQPSYPALVPYVMPLDVPIKNGLPRFVTESKYNGSGYTIIKKTEYQYATSETDQLTSKRKASALCYSYTISCEWLKRTKEIVSDYDVNGLNPVVKTTDYFYENSVHRQPTRIESLNSKGELVSRRFKYAPEKATELGGVYNTMSSRNMVGPVLEESEYNGANLVYKKTTSYTDWFADGKILTPAAEQYQKGSGTPYITARYKKYDTKGNVLQASKGDNDATTSYAWGYNNSLPVVKLLNAENLVSTQTGVMNVPAQTQTTQVSLSISNGNFTASIGFLNGPPSGPNYLIRLTYFLNGPANYTGGICLASASQISQCFGNPFTITINNVPAGNYTFGVITNALSSPGPIPTVSYSYQGASMTEEFFYQGFEDDATAAIANPFAGRRYKSGDYTVPFVKPNSKTYTVDYQYLSGGVWTYIKKTYTNSMTLTEGDAIDEVRVYVQNAQMFTYTYKPLVGTSSETDANGNTSFYEYDEVGRLIVIRDKDKKIVKKFCYNYSGQAENCTTYTNTDQSKNFNSQNCGPNQGPVPYYVSLPAGVFTSTVSVPAANQQANEYGQQLANLLGSCVTTYYSADATGNYYSQNCAWNEYPIPYYVSIPYGMFTSTSSQTHANSLATQYGQQQANQFGGCAGNLITFTYTNNSYSTDIWVEFTDVSTSFTYSFNVGYASGILGSVPEGTYNVRIYDNSWMSHYLYMCFNYGYGSDYTFYNVNVNSGCTTITID